MYIVKRWNYVCGSWNYFNTYRTYMEAAETRDLLTHQFGGIFKIFEA